jgi:thiosulfate/3-mercaptopyruvate sulfurtransferase
MADVTESQHPLLVTTAWVAERLDAPDFVLIDASAPDAYRRAHIPGAVSISRAPTLKSKDNSRLVMEADEFEPLVRRLGVSNDTPVILYDDNSSLLAAREWWVFDRFGHRDVRVLDGGFTAWLDEGRSLTSRAPRPEPGTFTAAVDDSHHCRIDDLLSRVEASDLQIWDVRSEGEWLGTNDRGNARAGHVLGAKWLEWTQLLEPPIGRFRPLKEIRELLEAAGINPGAETVSY